jgi:hypothetical protein
VAPESVEAQHSVDLLYSEAMESVEAQDSISGVVLDSVVAMESIDALDSLDALDSDVVPDSVDMVPDSVEVLPDSVEVVQCPRCGTFHAGGVFGEACYQARREARRCARCGLIHSDYDLTSWIFHDIEKFDCKFYIPDVEKLEMRGNTIILPEHVLMKLDEMQRKNSKVLICLHLLTCLLLQRLTCLHLLILLLLISCRKASNCFG